VELVPFAVRREPGHLARQLLQRHLLLRRRRRDSRTAVLLRLLHRPFLRHRARLILPSAHDRLTQRPPTKTDTKDAALQTHPRSQAHTPPLNPPRTSCATPNIPRSPSTS
jgi:hypothetical protein